MNIANNARLEASRKRNSLKDKPDDQNRQVQHRLDTTMTQRQKRAEQRISQ